MHSRIYIDNQPSPDYMVIEHIKNDFLPELDVLTTKAPGRPGSYSYGLEMGNRFIELEIGIIGTNKSNLEDRKRELSAWLLSDRPRELQLPHDNMYYMAQLADHDIDNALIFGRGTITFICTDPFAFSDTQLHEIDPAPVVTKDIDTESEWSGGTIDNLDVTSAGMQLSKRGTDYSYSDANWADGTITDLEIVDGSLRLLKDGTDYSRTEEQVQDFTGTNNNTKIVARTDIFEDFEDNQYEFTFSIPSSANVGWQRVTNTSFMGSGCWASVMMTPIPAQHQLAQSEFTFGVPIGATEPKLDLMYRVSSEANFDFFRIYINDEQVLEDSGQKPWTRFSYDLDEGAIYTVLLEYDIDGATSAGDNRVYIDNIRVSYTLPTSEAKIIIDGMPDYEFRDGLDDYTQSWRGAGTNGVTQEDGYVTILSSTSGATGLEKTNCVTFPFTLDCRVQSEGNSQVYISDGVRLFIVTLPITDTAWKWVRIRCIDDTTARVYMDGAQVGSDITSQAYTVNRLIMCYNSATENRANSIDAVYFACADLGEQPVNLGGTYTSQIYDLSSVGLLHAEEVDYQVNPDVSPFTAEPYSYTFEKRSVDLSGPTYGEWTTDAMFTLGEDLMGKGFQWRITMGTDDFGKSPSFESDTQSFTAAHAQIGTFESDELTDLQAVIVARDSIITWTDNVPANTTALVEVAWDFGDGMGPWEPASSGEDIPGIQVTDDLDNASLKYRITLSTTDASVTPSFNSLGLSLFTAYYGNGSRRGDAVSLAPIAGPPEISLITWDVTPDGSPNVEVFVQLVDTGAPYDDNAWVQADNGQPIPGLDGTDLSNKDLYSLIRLDSPDSGISTPQIHRLYWMAQAPTDDQIIYNGTAVAAPVFTIAFNDTTDIFSIRHDETGDQLEFNHDFSPGDELIVNCDNGRVTLNGVNALTFMAISSSWIRMKPGINTFTITPLNAVNVDVEWEGRYL